MKIFLLLLVLLVGSVQPEMANGAPLDTETWDTLEREKKYFFVEGFLEGAAMQFTFPLLWQLIKDNNNQIRDVINSVDHAYKDKTKRKLAVGAALALGQMKMDGRSLQEREQILLFVQLLLLGAGITKEELSAADLQY